MDDAHCRDAEAITPGLEVADAQRVLPALRDEVLSLELVEFAEHRVHRVPAYFFRMMLIATGDEVGRINLRLGADGHIRFHAGHVGYGVHPEFQGNRYASRALMLLKPLAGQLGIDPLCITCDPENVASRRSCEIAGATLVGVVDLPADCVIRRNGHPRKCLYHLPVPA
jgi:predicted acetyltransferase